MKITDVRAIHVRVEDPNMTLFDGSYDDCVIVVETDAGITGIGEVESLAPGRAGVRHAKDAHNHARGIAERVLGRTRATPRPLAADVRRDGLRRPAGRGDARDRRGRHRPVGHRRPGRGQARRRVARRIRHDRLPALRHDLPDGTHACDVARQVEDAMRMNLKNIKFAADPWWLDDVPLTTSLLKSARKTLGDAGKIIVDAALAYRTADEGLRLYGVYREIDIHFLEAPLPWTTWPATHAWRKRASPSASATSA
jgi:L-alanine-DL-glutamate epimerase-like enolase superfamily enzyme